MAPHPLTGEFEYVVLAAGTARRMGFEKTLAPLRGLSPLARVVSALGDRRFALVVPSALVAAAARIVLPQCIEVNDEPERGMTHSLRLGLRRIGADRPFGVLLADMPAMTQATIENTEALIAGAVDVAYPVDEHGVGGHPVIFSPRARRCIEQLREGDTLRYARDDPSLLRATWQCADRSAFFDLDEPADWNAF